VTSDRRKADREVGSAGLPGRGAAAREALILRLAPLARRIARRYAGGAEPIDDLEQVALIGLIKAIDRFDPERGPTLTRFAAIFIEGELRHHLRDNLGSPRVPRTAHSIATQTLAGGGELAAGLGRAPTVRELAAELDRSVEEINAALTVRSALTRPYSLDAVTEGETTRARDSLSEEDRRFDQVADRQLLAQVLRPLRRREQLVVFLRVVAGLSHRDIARRLGISPRHASRLYEGAIDRAVRAAARLAPPERGDARH
jgi:RNA polymerase sigma-B factor